MANRLIIAAVCIAAYAASPAQQKDWAQFSRYEEANKTVADEPRAVFMGNSITDGWATDHPDFFSVNNYIGRGIAGQTSSEMLVRFRSDVIDLHPETVVILAGTNDVAQNNGYIAPEHTLGNIISMVELAQANGIKPILCSVLPACDFPWKKGMEPAEKIIKLNKLIRAYAESNGIPYIDYHSAMKDEHNGLPEKYSPDGVHPSKEGYTLMEGLIKPAIDSVLQ